MPIKIYFTALVIFFAIDMVWLGLIAKDLYARQIGHLMTTSVNWAAALLFYFLFIAGLTIFVIGPALEKQSLMQAAALGAFFGLVTYATYDLTNLATLKNWPLLITVIDLMWGTTLGGAVSGLTYLIIKRIGS